MTSHKGITLHTEEDFKHLRKAGKLAAETLDMITPYVKPGASTAELDKIIHDFTIQHKATPGPLGYHGFPKSCCISLNHVVCHGIPSDTKILKEGDILNIDVTPKLNGWYGDTSRMYIVGKTSIKAKKLIKATYESMMAGINAVKPGATLGDIGYAIETIAHKYRYSIVEEFCGHGIGQEFHTAPQVLHYGTPGEGTKLKEGMVFTIEPMLNAGKRFVKILDDKWTTVTKDRSLSAQFEHMLGVTKDGCEIFTLSPQGFAVPPYD